MLCYITIKPNFCININNKILTLILNDDALLTEKYLYISHFNIYFFLFSSLILSQDL